MIIKCKMCGGDLEFQPGATYGTCEYCGSTSTIPQADDEGKLNRYNRANHFRRQCEFDKAVTAYEKLLEQDDTDAEAHWGAVISRYGIEYVEDPATKKRIPTCHRVQVASILADADYLAAVENAPDSASRDLYKQQAAEIAEIQKGILAISANEKPYDVFICYKETDENGQRTRDSQWAQDVYYGLTEQGYKVFFSRITLEDKLGQQYEPYIFAALNSAKVMVVIGSKPEYFNAVWVKNEWSRYLALMAKDRKRLLIPCYRGMDPYDLPEELSSLQSQDMSKIGFMQDLLRGIKKVLDADKKLEQPKVVQQVVQAAATAVPTNTAPLLRRAFMFLEDGDWESANEYCEKVLDLEPENGRAYLGKLMAELNVRSENSLDELAEPFDDMSNYSKAMRFGDAALQQKLKADIRTINERVEHNRQALLFADAKKRLERAATVQECAEARKVYESILSFEGVSAMLEKCDEKAEAIRASLYKKAVAAMTAAGDSSSKWDEAKRKLAERELNDYRDVAQLRTQAAKRYDECVAAEKEAQRRKIEKARREAEAAAAKKKRNTILGIVAALVIAVGIYVVTQIIIPGNNYNSAVQLLADGKYQEASDAFAALGGYKDAAACVNEPFYAQGKALLSAGNFEAAIAAFEKANGISDSATQISVCTIAIKDRDYLAAVELMGEGKYTEAIAAFEKLDGYKDSATQIKEAKYQQAGALNASGKYTEAYALYATISGYKDVDSLLVNDHNLAAAAAAAAAAARRAELATVGNTFFFGHYEQDNNTGNDKEAIEWQVLEVKGDKVLIISKNTLDAKPYNNSYTDITWEKCTLRTWLNKDFQNAAFSAAEQAGIETTTVDNSKAQGYSGYSTNGGNNTQDKIFFLSYAEAWKYFGSDSARVSTPTKYAKANEGNGYSDRWWLRSPGYCQDYAAIVNSVGSRDSSSVSSTRGVRPALWVNLESGIFKSYFSTGVWE